MCDQIKAASAQRLLERWGAVSAKTLDRVRQVVKLILQDERFHAMEVPLSSESE